MLEVLDNIPVTLEPETVMKRLRVRGREAQMEEMARELIDIALPVARPRAVYAVSPINDRTDNTVDIDGVRLTSRVLRINLDKVNRVFAYVATCGREMHELTVPSTDLLKAYCLDIIKMMVLGSAMTYLTRYIDNRYRPGRMSHMNPGSLKDWPLTQQKELFSILGDVEAAIGVTLTDGMAMVPIKSTSGIYFATEIRFESCQLCPNEGCIGRRAPYDPDLAKQYQTTPT